MERGIETIFSVLRGTKILFVAILLILAGVFLIVKSGSPTSHSGFILIVIGVMFLILNFKLRISRVVRRVKTDYR